MLVAHDATYLVDPHPSGISVYSRELMDGLARDHPEDSFLHFFRLKQFRKSTAPAFDNVSNRLLLPLLPPAPPWNKPDVFHALNQRVDQRSARAVVSTFHDLFVMTGEYSSADFRKRFTQQAQRAARKSDLIIAVSDFTRQQVVEYLRVNPQCVRVIPHGVHMPEQSPPLSAREKVILCVGALQLRKNVHRLVEAFEQLPHQVSEDWKLVLAGSTAGFGAMRILARIKQSSIATQIKVQGYVTAAELKDLYARASLFAFPSLDEGFGIPVVEAMANGIPVLTSNRSALPQVAGNAAILVDPYDIEAITDGLQRLIQSEELREGLRAKGFARARLYPWKRTVRETYQAYRELTS